MTNNLSWKDTDTRVKCIKSNWMDQGSRKSNQKYSANWLLISKTLGTRRLLAKQLEAPLSNDRASRYAITMGLFGAYEMSTDMIDLVGNNVSSTSLLFWPCSRRLMPAISFVTNRSGQWLHKHGSSMEATFKYVCSVLLFIFFFSFFTS